MFKRIFARKSTTKRKENDNSDIKPTSDIPENERLVTEDDNVEVFDDLSFIVDYIGSDYISEAQSIPLLLETLKRIKKQHTKTMRVDLVLNGGICKVTDNEQGALLITAPLYAIALCAQEYLRGFETTFAINITRRRIHMCHVFQAGSRLEVSFTIYSLICFSKNNDNTNIKNQQTKKYSRCYILNKIFI